METSDIMNLIYLFSCSSVNALYFAYGYVLTYHISFVKDHHPDYSFALVYDLLIVLDFGIFAVSLLYDRINQKIGIKNCYRLYGIVMASLCTMYCLFTHIFFLAIIYLMIGFSSQLMTRNLIFSINTLYPEKSVQYTGIVFSGTACAIIWFGLASILIINPHNKPKDMIHHIPGGGTEEYFSMEIAGRIRYFFAFYGFVNFCVAFLTSFLLPEKREVQVEENNDNTDKMDWLKLSIYSSRLTESIALNNIMKKLTGRILYVR